MLWFIRLLLSGNCIREWRWVVLHMVPSVHYVWLSLNNPSSLPNLVVWVNMSREAWANTPGGTLVSRSRPPSSWWLCATQSAGPGGAAGNGNVVRNRSTAHTWLRHVESQNARSSHQLSSLSMSAMLLLYYAAACQVGPRPVMALVTLSRQWAVGRRCPPPLSAGGQLACCPR